MSESDRFSIGDLVEYTDNLPFTKNYNSVGVVVEIIDFQEEWEKQESQPGLEYAKGFLEELRMYYALRSVEKTPDHYPADRQKILEKMLSSDKETYHLIRVVWNTGESYIEHPSDLRVVLKIREKKDEEV